MDFTLVLVLITLICGILLILRRIIPDDFFAVDIIDFFSSLFPILFAVLFFRSFVIEPFRIPSGSMIPTLLVGDFILVKKYEYGVRMPLTNRIIFEVDKPEYGDVIVFQYPENKSINYIKRVVALPGDKIEYRNKTIFVNDRIYKLNQLTQNSQDLYDDIKEFIMLENNGSREYMILNTNHRSNDFVYNVPSNSYFVLGDNRDNSNDSRYWGSVPKENLVGEAFLIWMYWNPNSKVSFFDRFGESID